MFDKNTIQKLKVIVKTLVTPGKGILAADESFPTIEKRFAAINLTSTEENRRAYRELFFTTPGIGKFLSGVIMFDETIRQSNREGKPFPQVLLEAGVITGIKVDQGTEALPDSPLEKVTKGLAGLKERLQEYVKLGAKFTKWRAVITIGTGLPTRKALLENAKIMAQYAKLSQEAGLAPIVEPEVLMDGDHTIERCEEVTIQTLKEMFKELKKKEAALERILLKPNMVLSGKECPVQASPQEAAEATLRVLKNTVPKEVPGIVFLSGGQSEAQATLNLNEINKLDEAPWELSFSYGRALQAEALKIWQGQAEKVPAAQAVFYHRAKLVSLARAGKYTSEMEKR